MYAKNIWVDAKEEKKAEIFSFSKDYMNFLDEAKTERMATKQAVRLAKEKGFRPLEECKELHPGDKVYTTNKNKNFLAAIIGEKSLEEGMRILGAHIDSPRLDIKQNPLYEKGGFAFFETHYYGGIKKYQYVTIPLALHGIVYKKDGTSFEVSIGEDPSDPVLGITDLLIHLSADQMSKKASEVIEGEKLDITIGNIPLEKDENGKVKDYILHLLKEKYGMEEEDFRGFPFERTPRCSGWKSKRLRS